MDIHRPYILVLLTFLILASSYVIKMINNEQINFFTNQRHDHLNQMIVSHDKSIAIPTSKHTRVSLVATEKFSPDNTDNAWYRDHAMPIKAFPFDNPNDIQHYYLNFNRTVIQKLEQGSRLPFYIPHSTHQFIGLVKSVLTSDSGDTIYSGSLQDYDADYEFVITQGLGNTYASINTPEGNFILESVGADAWLYDDRKLSQNIDFTMSDAVTKNFDMNMESYYTTH